MRRSTRLPFMVMQRHVIEGGGERRREEKRTEEMRSEEMRSEERSDGEVRVAWRAEIAHVDRRWARA